LRKALAGMFVAALLFVAAAPGYANQLYSQPFDMTGNAYSSQNDTTGGNGNFATVYDDFTLGSSAMINNVQWVGEFFNPVEFGNITAFTVDFYANNGGIPGSLLSTNYIAGDANETDIGNYNGFEAYSYSLDVTNFAATAGTEYWMSIEPDLGFPPQWGWSTSSVGDGMGYQCFDGSCGTIGGVNLAFTLNGGQNTGTPEPASLFLMGSGLLMLGGMVRRRLCR
jgi:hypothetical protein